MKTFKFSLVLRTRENTDVFITLDESIYGIHSKRVNILYVFVHFKMVVFVHFKMPAYHISWEHVRLPTFVCTKQLDK